MSLNITALTHELTLQVKLGFSENAANVKGQGTPQKKLNQKDRKFKTTLPKRPIEK